MRVEVDPRTASVRPGLPTVMTVRVVNTGTVISGCRIRVLGVDPRWATLDQEQLSLFPDSAGIAVVTVTFPPGIPAGIRRIGIEVQELTPPSESQLVEVELTVPAELGLNVELDPVTQTGGKRATVGVLVDNTGNGPVEIELTGADEEGQVHFAFVPVSMVLAAGERTLATAELRAKRPILGSPKIRPFKVLVGPGQPPVGTVGNWVQKPLLSRGAIALIALLVVASVFAAILTVSLSKVVDKSTADRQLALQVAGAGGSGAGGGGSGSIAGTVTLLTSAAPVPGVTAEIFTASNVATPLASTATKAAGTYEFAGLGVGDFKIRFRGAGFSELWYPTSLTADNAMAITLTAGQAKTGVDARLGGVPASLAGQVFGTDPTGAVVSLQLPSATPGAGAAVSTGSAGTSPAAAIVTTQTLDASGTFSLTQIPSPSAYQLIVTKQGFATAVQQVNLGSGEQRKGISITLQKGDGSISGTVSDATGPIGGAAITASDGHTSASTVSLTQGNIGGFTVSNLPTPSTFTLTVSNPGSATQTLTLTLSAGQQLTGVSVTLAKGAGSISGTATLATAGSPPAGGVTVTVTNGKQTLQTVTLSTGNAGTYQVSGLVVPSTYTVTFSRSDLASQTRAVSLDSSGSSSATGINVSMTPGTAVLSGTVYESQGGTQSCATSTSGLTPVGEVTVNLSSGSNSYVVTSSSAPTMGAYEFDNVQPGTYTVSFTRPGGLPTSAILGLGPGDHKNCNPILAKAALISGLVHNTSAAVQADVQVILFQADQFPSGRSASTTTNGAGMFSFANLNAPQSYVLQFAYPQGSAGQLTVAVPLRLSEQKTDIGSLPCPLPPTTTLPTTTTLPPPTTTTTNRTFTTGGIVPAVFLVPQQATAADPRTCIEVSTG